MLHGSRGVLCVCFSESKSTESPVLTKKGRDKTILLNNQERKKEKSKSKEQDWAKDAGRGGSAHNALCVCVLILSTHSLSFLCPRTALSPLCAHTRC